jgi:hypothetical protein
MDHDWRSPTATGLQQRPCSRPVRPASKRRRRSGRRCPRRRQTRPLRGSLPRIARHSSSSSLRRTAQCSRRLRSSSLQHIVRCSSSSSSSSPRSSLRHTVRCSSPGCSLPSSLKGSLRGSPLCSPAPRSLWQCRPLSCPNTTPRRFAASLEGTFAPCKTTPTETCARWPVSRQGSRAATSSNSNRSQR